MDKSQFTAYSPVANSSVISPTPQANIDCKAEVNVLASLTEITPVTAFAQTVTDSLKKSPSIPEHIIAVFTLLIFFVTLLWEKESKRVADSTNSSKPPSQDPNRPKNNRPKGVNKPGGQPGHPVETLRQVPDPDIVQRIAIDKTKLDPNHIWRQVDEIKRQVFDIEISRRVTEYQAEVYENELGVRVTADFPEGVNAPVQYGKSIKSTAIYLLEGHLMPQERIAEFFDDICEVPISPGSINNFKKEAVDSCAVLEFGDKIIGQLLDSPAVNCDETSINVGGVKFWTHLACTPLLTYYFLSRFRGVKGMVEAKFLEFYRGVICHDFWKAYYCFK